MLRTAFAPAKVNLFLHVGAPGADGYHPLCSLMAFADVGDRVLVGPLSPGPGSTVLALGGPFAEQLSGFSDNLVVRAAKALWGDRRGVPFGAHIGLEKNLPVASGLGGGSSDAGATLRLLRDTWQLGIDDTELQRIAVSLGADGAACLWGRPVIAEGRGERLSPAPDFAAVDAVLVNSGVPVSTAGVYAAFDAAGDFGDIALPAMPAAFADAPELAAWLAGQRNDLEAAAIAAAPQVGVVLETLAGEPETLLARVSGSGGTCFALCAGDIEAQSLAERIAALAPGWWVKRCRLGGPWPDA